MRKSITIAAIFLVMTIPVLAQNVGIGTTTPLFKLDIVGRPRIQAGTVGNVSTSAGIWHTDYRDNVENVVFVGMVDSVNYGFYGNRPSVGWQFHFDARNGNIGIGMKPSTIYRLSVEDADGANVAFLKNGDFKGAIRATDSTLTISADYTSGLCIPSCPPAKDLILYPPGTFNGISNPAGTIAGNVGILVHKPKTDLHINGNVLIGGPTVDPAAGYRLSIDGKAICEELKVQNNTVWPDYVFESNYNLPSLETLQQTVMQQKHLPGIPSAAEINKDKGFELGSMQQKLLEKIEELYLYVFQINEENKKLKAEITELKKEK